jgi:protein-disulfide isomerase
MRYLARRSREALPLFASLLGALLLTQHLMPPYWEMKSPVSTASLQQGLTTDGLPWIGAENPKITIVEFADYQCFQCRKMHFYLRELAAQNPGAIRIVHRHYPMDNEFNYVVPEPFHVGSGKMALLAIHAEAKGKFWEMNDLLYALGGRRDSIDIAEIGGAIGIEDGELAAALDHPSYRARLGIDIRHGMKLRILGTPSYIIDGAVYQGNIPPDVLAGILKRASAE